MELPGEFSVRGGIVDIFAPDWDGPVRVEFFGDEIESIRRFEISSQRSLESLDAVDVTIVGPAAADRAHLADYLPPQSWFLLLEPMELEQQGRQYLERLDRAEAATRRNASRQLRAETATTVVAFHTVSDVSAAGCSASRRSPPRPWPPARWRRPAG